MTGFWRGVLLGAVLADLCLLGAALYELAIHGW